jgi:hypothetical protein
MGGLDGPSAVFLERSLWQTAICCARGELPWVDGIADICLWPNLYRLLHAKLATPSGQTCPSKVPCSADNFTAEDM